MIKQLCWLIGIAMWCVPVFGVQLKPDLPERYVVVAGDTLWDIAGKYMYDPWYWPEIWYVNQQINNPHLIYPGDLLTFSYDADGKPRVSIEQRAGAGVANGVKLLPHARIEAIQQAIPTIPIDAIKQLLVYPMVLGKNELEKSPYVLSSRDERLISGAAEKVYGRSPQQIWEAQRYRVYRSGQVYYNPGSREVLGYEAIYVGDAEVERPGDPALLYLTQTNREVRAGDRLVPMLDADNMDMHFLPHSPVNLVKGQIIAVYDGVQRIGQYQVVVMNLGLREGINRGHVLAVYQQGRKVRDQFIKARSRIDLPEERAGILMVFRVFERVSYALVMTAFTDMKVLDHVRNP